MTEWRRERALDPSASEGERWTSPAGASYDVSVRSGKPLDVVALKGSGVEEAAAYAQTLERLAAELYADRTRLELVERCPCCDGPATEALVAIEVFSIGYRRCPVCAHLFVGLRPVATELEQRFVEEDAYAHVYTDRAALETRMEQIVAPKVDWVCEVFRERFGRQPARVADVGAGGGHFLAGLARRGIEGVGFELSRASRAFAERTFGLELRSSDFRLADTDVGPVDVVTFWGLLEYTPDPVSFLRSARERLDPGRGLLVLEVPRAESLSTAIQSQPGAVVARHLDPTSHVNCFSDASICAALERSGFAPVAAWYFGMDAYEVVVQAARMLGGESFEPLAELLLPLQQAFDDARLCDDVIVAAVPLE